MLDITALDVAIDSQHILQSIHLYVAPGEIVCLLGASGCGKTTLLRSIVGLQQVHAGDIRVNNKSIINLPVHQRKMGLMFQDYALFPHMSVYDNVAFGLRMQSLDKKQVEKRVRAALTFVGLDEYGDRRVTELSGGEQQRVALARSYAPQPYLLLLDEPLGSIDAAMKDDLAIELRGRIKQAGLTSVYVTHDQREAFVIADRIAIMENGSIQQIATPEELYLTPKTGYVARFLGLNNIVPILDLVDDNHITPIGSIPAHADNKAFSELLFHPIGLSITSQPTTNAFKGKITEKVFQGEYYRVSVALEDTEISFTLTVPLTENPIPNNEVFVRYNPNAVIPLN